MLFWRNFFKFVNNVPFEILRIFKHFQTYSNIFKMTFTSHWTVDLPHTTQVIYHYTNWTMCEKVFPYANIRTLLFNFTFDFSSLIYILIPVFCVCLQDFGASSFCSIIRFLNLFFQKVFITVKIFGDCVERFYMLFWRNFFKFVK